MSGVSNIINAILQIEEGIQVLMTAGVDTFVATAFSSSDSYSPVIGFEEAKKRFIQSDYYSSAILLQQSHPQLNGLDGLLLQRHIRSLLRDFNTPYQWAIDVYEDSEATEADYELAYNMYQSFVTAVGRLNEVFKKINNKELKVHWKPNTAPKLDKLPELPAPKPLNRKI